MASKKTPWFLLAALAGGAWWFMRGRKLGVPATAPIVQSAGVYYSVMVEDSWLRSFNTPAEAYDWIDAQGGFYGKAIIYTVENGQVVPNSGVYA